MNDQRHRADGTWGMRQRWVVGHDGSAGADAALSWAIAHADGRTSSIDVVTAWQVPVTAVAPTEPSLVLPIDEDLIADGAEQTAQSAVERRTEPPSNATLNARAHRGAPASVLLAEAAEADLLVVGSRGHGGFSRLLLGSTSTQCATHSGSPTCVVRHDGPHRPAETILVGVDGSENSRVGLEWALDFAAGGSQIRVVWVWNAAPLAVGADEFFFPDASDTAEERFHQLVDGVVATADRADVEVGKEFLHGVPRSVLTQESETADLVVVGARGHGAIGSALLGSVSTSLLHHVNRPITVVPPPAEPAAPRGSAADEDSA